MLLDSNIVIYAAQWEYANLRTFIAEYAPAVSVITQIEVLGYHKLREVERIGFEHFFHVTEEVCYRSPRPLSNKRLNFANGGK